MNNKDLIAQYLDTGQFIGDYQLKLLSGNLLQTYLRKRMITVSSNNGVLSPYEFKILDDDNKKKYLTLTIRRHDLMNHSMFSYCDDEIKTYYINEIIHYKESIAINTFNLLNDSLKLRYMIYRFERGYSNEYMIPECSEELLYEYFTFIINSGRLLSDNIYSLLPKELQTRYNSMRNG